MSTACNKKRPRKVVETLIELFGENDIELLITIGALDKKIATSYKALKMFNEMNIPEKYIKYEKIAAELGVSPTTAKRLLL